MRAYVHQQVFSTGEWWDIVEAPHIGEPWLYGRMYVADDVSVPHNEAEVLLAVFTQMLQAVTGDGSRKRHAGTKPPWWKDESHRAAIFSHLNRYEHGERVDHDSGAHPFVHLAWRALAIAYQETYGKVDPAVHPLPHQHDYRSFEGHPDELPMCVCGAVRVVRRT